MVSRGVVREIGRSDVVIILLITIVTTIITYLAEVLKWKHCPEEKPQQVPLRLRSVFDSYALT